jgi:hypothetical protein
MIPKRAFFIWVGDDPLPWLRQISVDSFRKQNPDWGVGVIRLTGTDDLMPAQQTDIARYEELTYRGGLYLDTDILFFKPVPDSVLDSDVAITIDKSAFNDGSGSDPRIARYPGFSNLAFLGASPDNPFFRHTLTVATDRFDSLTRDDVDVRRHNYQLFGTELLNRTFVDKDVEDIEAMFGVKIHNVPLDLVLPVRWYDAFKLFNGTRMNPPEEAIGYHWYGGCYDAKRYQQQLTRENCGRRRCLLTEVIQAVDV